MTVCKTCGTALAPSKKFGRPRCWCSERCRKTQYAAVCVDCGAPTSGSQGRRETPRCFTCARRAVVASGTRPDMIRAKARREKIAELWREGLTLKQIAAELSSTANAIGTDIARMRAAGYDLPYRPGYPR